MPQFLQPVEFRPAETVEELNTAMQLVYREYVQRGYMCPNHSRTKHLIFQAIPTTVTFIAKHKSAGIIGTITVIEDSPLGLPMDEIYKAELDRLRKQGLRIAEVSMLALDSRLFGKGVFTLFHSKKLLLTLKLFKALFDFVRTCTDCDELAACFNPKHEILYDFLHLKPLGGIKKYFGANGNPAVARHLNIQATEQKAKAHPAYKLFFGDQLDPEKYATRLQFKPAELQFIFMELSQLFKSASPTEINYIRSCYPDYPFDDILCGKLPTESIRSSLIA